MTLGGFRWTEWSTPPVTATIVVACWAMTLLLIAGAAGLLGFSDGARTAFGLARALLAGGSALLVVAAIAGFAPARRPSERRTSVERPAQR